MKDTCHANPKYHTMPEPTIRKPIVGNGGRERRTMTQGSIGNPSPENGSDTEGIPNPMDKAVWSPPTLTRLDGKETQGIPPHNPGAAPKKQIPEEMIFFGS
jgi:hypothetical protein